jgi:CDP-diacylglycerol--serine O-phosphatidyltransferase
MALLRHIPNIITLSNLLLGCLGIIFAGWGDLISAARCIYIAAALDFFDGFAARALKASSPIGKDLDSLADVVSFGVLPGLLLYQLSASVPGFIGLEYTALLLPLLSALRLARFNHDTRQSDKFIGLPTPASAILVASLLIWLFSSPQSRLPELNKTMVAGFSFGLALLLNAPFELFALKFKHFGWKGNELVYIFLIFSLILIISLSYLGLAFVILAYILVSAVLALFKPNIR